MVICVHGRRIHALWARVFLQHRGGVERRGCGWDVKANRESDQNQGANLTKQKMYEREGGKGRQTDVTHATTIRRVCRTIRLVLDNLGGGARD